VLLALVAVHKWPLIQLDANNAFLNGNFFEEVYVDLPLGYSPKVNAPPKGEHLVCQLHKSIYGLK